MRQKLNCILLIDDDEATNFLNNMIIEEADCALHIKTNQTAKAALNYISDSAPLNGQINSLPYPDLIFLDINMPAMDGWDFLGEYKVLSYDTARKPIIIMLSSSVNPDDKLKALSIPEVSDIQNKPMTTEIINTVVAKYFPQYM